METPQSIQIILSDKDKPRPCRMYIDFTIFSDKESFNPSDLTDKIQMQPTVSWFKGDLIRKDLYRKETCWRLDTPTIETFDVEEVFYLFLSLLDEKLQILSEYIKANGLCVKICPVVVVNGTMPSIIITKEMQEILLRLGATMEFDMYFA